MITKSRGATKPKIAAELDARPRRAVPKTNGAARQFATDLRNTSLPTGIAANNPDAEPLSYPHAVATDIRELPLDKIEISKDNPRTHFEPEALRQLADSILAHGMIQPVVVRPPGALAKNFELVAGERRYRAAKLAGLATVRVDVRILSDAAAAEIRLVENLEREDLTAIEEATAMQKMLDQLGYTQERLAEKLKRSQPHIANRLRLLKLPKAWQAKIISRELPATHAREMVRYAGIPAVVKEINKRFFGKHSWAIGSLDEFCDGLERCAYCHLQPIAGKGYAGAIGHEVGFFVPTTAQRKKLGIVKIDDEEYATNRNAWRKFRGEQIAELVKDKAETQKAKKGKTVAPTRTPAQEKQLAKKQAAQFARRLKEWRANWLRRLLYDLVATDASLALRCVLMAMNHYAARPTERGAIARLFGFKDSWSKGIDVAIATYSSPTLLLVAIASEWFWSAEWDEPDHNFGDEEVEVLARAESIDLEKHWRQDLAGPLTEAYFNLHNKEQLDDLATEFGATESYAHLKKSELVAALIANNATCSKLPKEIKRLEPLSKKPAAAPKVKKNKGKQKTSGGR